MKQDFWRDAARSGVVIGVIVAASAHLKTWLMIEGSGMAFAVSIAELFAVAYFIYVSGKRRSGFYEEYTYGRSMKFIMATMLLAGVVYGVGQYFLVNRFAVDFYRQRYDAAVEIMSGMVGAQAMEEGADMAWKMMASPLYWVFYGALAMTVYGGLVGLFVSAFLRKR